MSPQVTSASLVYTGTRREKAQFEYVFRVEADDGSGVTALLEEVLPHGPLAGMEIRYPSGEPGVLNVVVVDQDKFVDSFLDAVQQHGTDSPVMTSITTEVVQFLIEDVTHESAEAEALASQLVEIATRSDQQSGQAGELSSYEIARASWEVVKPNNEVRPTPPGMRELFTLAWLTAKAWETEDPLRLSDVEDRMIESLGKGAKDNPLYANVTFDPDTGIVQGVVKDWKGDGEFPRELGRIKTTVAPPVTTNPGLSKPLFDPIDFVPTGPVQSALGLGVRAGAEVVERAAVRAGAEAVEGAIARAGTETVERIAVQAGAETLEGAAVRAGTETVETTLRAGPETIEITTVRAGAETIETATVRAGTETVEATIVREGAEAVETTTIRANPEKVQANTVKEGAGVEGATLRAGAEPVDDIATGMKSVGPLTEQDVASILKISGRENAEQVAKEMFESTGGPWTFSFLLTEKFSVRLGNGDKAGGYGSGLFDSLGEAEKAAKDVLSAVQSAGLPAVMRPLGLPRIWENEAAQYTEAIYNAVQVQKWSVGTLVGKSTIGPVPIGQATVFAATKATDDAAALLAAGKAATTIPGGAPQVAGIMGKGSIVLTYALPEPDVVGPRLGEQIFRAVSGEIGTGNKAASGAWERIDPPAALTPMVAAVAAVAALYPVATAVDTAQTTAQPGTEEVSYPTPQPQTTAQPGTEEVSYPTPQPQTTAQPGTAQPGTEEVSYPNAMELPDGEEYGQTHAAAQDQIDAAAQDQTEAAAMELPDGAEYGPPEAAAAMELPDGAEYGPPEAAAAMELPDGAEYGPPEAAAAMELPDRAEYGPPEAAAAMELPDRAEYGPPEAASQDYAAQDEQSYAGHQPEERTSSSSQSDSEKDGGTYDAQQAEAQHQQAEAAEAARHAQAQQAQEAQQAQAQQAQAQQARG
jgi:hypothetical protein